MFHGHYGVPGLKIFQKEECNGRYLMFHSRYASPARFRAGACPSVLGITSCTELRLR